MASRGTGGAAKYVRLVRRRIKGRARWFCQLVQREEEPLLREPVNDVVGLDIGSSTIAAVSNADVILERFCPGVEERNKSGAFSAPWIARAGRPTLRAQARPAPPAGSW